MTTKSKKSRKQTRPKAIKSRKAKNDLTDPGLRSARKPRSGIIVLEKGGGTLKKVRYSAIRGKAIFEGDICLGTIEELEATVANNDLALDQMPVSGASIRDVPVASLGAAGLVISEASASHEEGVIVTGPQFRWPNAIVPYEIHPKLPNTSRVRDAIKHWETKTKIHFVERTPVNSAQFKDYVSFEAQDGCWSQVGRRGGKQIISLGNGCLVGQAIHEIGHAVGLWHEQSREDRAQFIRIVWPNIMPGHEHNFDQHIVDGDDVGIYDYRSIMHYPPTAFSKNGLPTIIPLKSGGTHIGQRSGLSKGDIAAVQVMYP